MLGVGVGAPADPVPLGEVGRGRPRLLPVEDPAPVVASGLELHGGGVGPGVGLRVADGELDLVAQDLGQELGLQPLVAVPDDRLADDADALADLRAAAAGELLVEQVLVDPLALRPPVLLGPGHAEPAPLPHRLHEGAPLGRVDDLGHVLPGHVEDLGVVVGVEEGLDLLHEGQLLRREFELHALPPRARRNDLTARQMRRHHRTRPGVAPRPDPEKRSSGQIPSATRIPWSESRFSAPRRAVRESRTDARGIPPPSTETRP